MWLRRGKNKNAWCHRPSYRIDICQSPNFAWFWVLRISPASDFIKDLGRPVFEAFSHLMPVPVWNLFFIFIYLFFPLHLRQILLSVSSVSTYQEKSIFRILMIKRATSWFYWLKLHFVSCILSLASSYLHLVSCILSCMLAGNLKSFKPILVSLLIILRNR